MKLLVTWLRSKRRKWADPSRSDPRFRGSEKYPVPPGCELTHPVGAIQGYNLPNDVARVQWLLNGVPPAKGGPAKPLTPNGVCDPETMKAIERFALAYSQWPYVIYPNSLLHVLLCMKSDNSPLFPSPYTPLTRAGGRPQCP